jgi:hypothetical protein
MSCGLVSGLVWEGGLGMTPGGGDGSADDDHDDEMTALVSGTDLDSAGGLGGCGRGTRRVTADPEMKMMMMIMRWW